MSKPKLVPVLLILSLGLIACGGSDGDGDASPITTADASSATTGDVPSSTVNTGDTVSTTAPLDPTPSPDDTDSDAIEGSWVADAQTLLDANMANMAGSVLKCDGLVRLAFADGTMKQTGDVDCSLPGQAVTAHGVIDSHANYSVDGNHLSITDSVHDTQMSIGGVPGSVLTFFGDGDATYSVANDVLTIEFAFPSVGDITQTWTRD